MYGKGTCWGLFRFTQRGILALFFEGLGKSRQMPAPGRKGACSALTEGPRCCKHILSAALTQASQLIRLRYEPGLCKTQTQAMNGRGLSLNGPFFLPLSKMNSPFRKGGKRSYCRACRLDFVQSLIWLLVIRWHDPGRVLRTYVHH